MAWVRPTNITTCGATVSAVTVNSSVPNAKTTATQPDGRQRQRRAGPPSGRRPSGIEHADDEVEAGDQAQARSSSSAIVSNSTTSAAARLARPEHAERATDRLDRADVAEDDARPARRRTARRRAPPTRPSTTTGDTSRGLAEHRAASVADDGLARSPTRIADDERRHRPRARTRVAIAPGPRASRSGSADHPAAEHGDGQRPALDDGDDAGRRSRWASSRARWPSPPSRQRRWPSTSAVRSSRDDARRPRDVRAERTDRARARSPRCRTTPGACPRWSGSAGRSWRGRSRRVVTSGIAVGGGGDAVARRRRA